MLVSLGAHVAFGMLITFGAHALFAMRASRRHVWPIEVVNFVLDLVF